MEKNLPVITQDDKKQKTREKYVRQRITSQLTYENFDFFSGELCKKHYIHLAGGPGGFSPQSKGVLQKLILFFNLDPTTTLTLASRFRLQPQYQPVPSLPLSSTPN